MLISIFIIYSDSWILVHSELKMMQQAKCLRVQCMKFFDGTTQCMSSLLSHRGFS